MKKWLALLLIVPLISVGVVSLRAQDEGEDEFTQKLMEQVDKKLQAHHAAMMKKIAAMVEGELKKQPRASGTVKMDDEIRALQEELAGMKKRIAEIEKKLRELQARPGKKQEDPPQEEESEDGMTLEEANQMFQQGFEHHQEEKYDEAIELFKKIVDKFPTHNLGYTSAYNIACAYSLKGDKKQALKWLETSVKNGFRNFDHIEQDSDLDNIRDEAEYQRILDEWDQEMEKQD